MKAGADGVNGLLVQLHVTLEQRDEPDNAYNLLALEEAQKLKHVRNNLFVVSNESILIHHSTAKNLMNYITNRFKYDQSI